MKEHILVVDDDEIVRTGLSENLEREEYRVSTAASGEEALAIVGARDIDLVLCDLVMEGMDGMQLLRKIRASKPDLLFIMITGYGSMSNAIDALRLGASDYVQKPVNPDEIIHRVETVLDAARLRQNMLLERQKSEERKRELYDRLVRAERMVSLGVLADGMAYELNNILGPVVSYPQLILEHLPEDSPIRNYIVEMQEAGRRASQELKDLQILGKGGEHPHRPMDLNEIIRRYMGSDAFEKVKASRTDIFVETQLAQDLPAIEGSEGQLARVLANLLGNAIEAMPGGGRLIVSTGVRRMEQAIGRYEQGEAGDYVVLTAEDSGVGMAREELEKIFEPFFTRKSRKKREVSGLGLTVVYQVVRDHGGYVDVESTPGRGSVFTLYFPLREELAQPVEESLMDYGGSETVMVVDDYEEQRKVAGALLETLGYNVITAESGRAAVKIFEEMAPAEGKHPVDLVVMDMILADDFDGLEAYKKIIEINPDQRAVIVSGFAETDRIIEARKLGVGRYVQKPYSLESLGKAVREELDEI